MGSPAVTKAAAQGTTCHPQLPRQQFPATDVALPRSIGKGLFPANYGLFSVSPLPGPDQDVGVDQQRCPLPTTRNTAMTTKTLPAMRPAARAVRYLILTAGLALSASHVAAKPV